MTRDFPLTLTCRRWTLVNSIQSQEVAVCGLEWNEVAQQRSTGLTEDIILQWQGYVDDRRCHQWQLMAVVVPKGILRPLTGVIFGPAVFPHTLLSR